MIGTGWAAAAPEGPGAALLGIRHVADSTGTLAMKKVKRSKALLAFCWACVLPPLTSATQLRKMARARCKGMSGPCANKILFTKQTADGSSSQA